MRLRALHPSLLAFVSVSLAACVVSRGMKVESVKPAAPLEVSVSVKVHLVDGSTVVFPKGVKITGDRVKGKGVSHDLALQKSMPVDGVALDKVAAMETFRQDVNVAATAALSVLATAGTAFASALALVAIFGSCPTVYSGPEASPRLEAETFSYSIASLFEKRDLDRLSADAGPDGSLRLEVRNEALETHYINHLQVLEVRHREGETVMPDPTGRPIVVGPRRRLSRVSDRANSDLREVLSTADDEAFRTDRRTLQSARASDLTDWIDVTFPTPAAVEAALVLRARSSLLNTVLFYDVMLADAGPFALHWLGRDLERISNAVELGRFCRRHLGLRVALWSDGAFQPLAHLPDPGPIAWHEVAVQVPVRPGAEEVRLRLTFLADAWRIDSLTLAASVRTEPPRTLEVKTVTGPTGLTEAAARESLGAPDRNYLKTTPGQRFFLRFDAEPLGEGERRTFLLSSQGYYTEWVRGDWLRAASEPRAFVPGEEALVAALARWQRVQPSFEARFDRDRVPVQ